MPTVKVNLDTTQYIQVNTSLNPLLLQAHRDTVRIALSAVKPSRSNTVFHLLGDGDEPLQFFSIDTDVWALAMTDRSSLVVSETGPASVVAGESDLALDTNGIQKVTQDFSLLHGLFTFDIPPSLWLIAEDGVEILNSTSTRATSIDGYANVRSGTTAGQICHLESRRHPRYQPDRGMKFAASIGFKGANLDGILEAGFLVDNENGVYFKTKGDGNLYACVLNDGVETHEEIITFPFTIDITKGNLYDIRVQWRGVAKVEYFVGSPITGFLVKVHEINFLNTLDEGLIVRNPAMSVGFHAENITQQVSLWCGCVDVTSEGGSVDRQQYGEFSGDRTVTAGGTDTVLVLRNPHLAPNGKINTRDLSLARVTISADKKATFKLYQTRDETAIVGGTWGTVKTGSFVEGNTTVTSVDLTKMEEFSTFKVPAGIPVIKDNPSKDTIDFFGIHGDYIAVVCTSGSNIVTEASIEWGEEI
jgi:hypothetical protein